MRSAPPTRSRRPAGPASLTFPRELSLGRGRLISRPAVELFELRTAELAPAEPIRESAFEVVAEGPLELVLVDPGTGIREVAAQTSGAARVLVDGSIVEVFGDGPPATSRHYPSADAHWEVSTTRRRPGLASGLTRTRKSPRSAPGGVSRRSAQSGRV